MKLKTDIAIIGGSLGGVAAALAALEQGYRVILTESSDWLGGQMTSQGTSALDEHPRIESEGCTRRYAQMRQRIRQHYHDRYQLKPRKHLNPGDGWVSRLCFEPRVGEQVLREMLETYQQNQQLTILYKLEPIQAVVQRQVIKQVTLKNSKQHLVTIQAKYFLDATDLGDLLPLTQTAYVCGAEASSDTGEPHASLVAKPEEVQSFTYCFAIEYCPNEHHLIKKPKGYQRFKKTQPYSLTLDASTRPRHFKMFKKGSKGTLPFWTYRRIFAAKQFKDPKQLNDIALINWPSNDYYLANIIDKPAAEQKRILQEAKNLALGFLYWLQTECPRDEGGFGYPEFRLRKDIMGTPDGLSKFPYIRESRRIKALERILEQDISASKQRKKAKHYANSVGIGWYQMDLHACVGNKEASLFAPTLPFQIPLGALIPVKTKNLLPACKNIGTTHLTNGAYRLHPVEWAIGEAAGVLAVYCLEHTLNPRQVWESKPHTKSLQKRLKAQGAPLSWNLK